jgi:RHS repeat-associated protein
MIVEASTTFAYDAEGRMIRSTIPYATGTVITQYFYDGEGRRVKKQNQALGKTLYVYDAFGKLAVEFPEQALAPCATCYLFTDQVNTTRLVLDQGGTVMKRADHMPFGEEILNGAPWANGRGSLYADNNPVRQQFTGYLRNEPYEWALDFANARYYRRSIGRFTSPDPLLSSGRPDNPQSWNRYGYGFNNPLRFIDPTGLFNWDSSLGGDATDDQLRKTMAKKEANRIIKQRKNITNALNKMAKSGDSALSGVASAYGSAGDNNGVTIAAGPVTPGAAAQAENAVPLGYDSRGNTEVTVTVPQNASGNGLFISLAHEGAHVQDAQNVGAFGTSGNVSMTRYDTEMHGYMLTMSAARYLGLPGASATVGSTTFQFWNPAWTKTDLQTQPRQNIDRFLNASPMYNNPARNKRLTDYVYQSGRGGN